MGYKRTEIKKETARILDEVTEDTHQALEELRAMDEYEIGGYRDDDDLVAGCDCDICEKKRRFPAKRHPRRH